MNENGANLAQRRISSVVRVYMAAHDHTHDDLARKLGLSRPAVSQRLSGRNPWTLADLEKVSKLYGVTVQELVDGTILEHLGVFLEERMQPTLELGSEAG